MVKDYYTLYLKGKAKLTYERYSDRKDTLYQSYIFQEGRIGTHEGNLSDSLYLIFIKSCKGIDFTLSHRFDSITNMKLTHAKIINSPMFMPAHNMKIHRFEQSYWMEEIFADSSKKIMKYFSADEINNP